MGMDFEDVGKEAVTSGTVRELVGTGIFVFKSRLNKNPWQEFLGVTFYRYTFLLILILIF